MRCERSAVDDSASSPARPRPSHSRNSPVRKRSAALRPAAMSAQDATALRPRQSATAPGAAVPELAMSHAAAVAPAASGLEPTRVAPIMVGGIPSRWRRASCSAGRTSQCSVPYGISRTLGSGLQALDRTCATPCHDVSARGRPPGTHQWPQGSGQCGHHASAPSDPGAHGGRQSRAPGSARAARGWLA